MCRITSKAHAQCTEKLSRLRSSMHALISCELEFIRARSQHNHPRVRVRRTHCQTPSSGGSHKLPAWRATTTPALHRLHRSTAAAMCRITSMAHVRQAESCCSHVQDYLHGSRSVHEAAFTAATLGACVHFVCCIDTSVACIHFSWQQAARNSQEQSWHEDFRPTGLCTPWLTLHADAFFWREH